MKVVSCEKQFKYFKNNILKVLFMIPFVFMFTISAYAEEVIELEVGYEALEEYKTYQLDPDVNYISEDESVATVSKNGLVTAVRFGETNILVLDENGNAIDQIEVIVYLVGDEPVPWGVYSFDMSYVTGYPDGMFKPKNFITRAEVATMFSKILRLESKEEIRYSDMEKDHWSYEYVQKVSSVSLMNLRSENEFFPDSYLTRREFAILLSNYAKLQGFELNGEVKYDVCDVDFEDYAFTEIHEMLNVKILDTTDGMFYPEDFTAREKAVSVINKIIDRKVILESKQTFSDVIPADDYYLDIEAAADGL